ncbi:MAG: hypothetical protein HZA61_05450 [Candidatus Eisenbacteria bacterium]|uniref:Uncharacterized protein n=1 Tax=Eiseniibacteriota bacterium TaxID=2212470 RepID=A0A933SFA4_UNCEI|nr:hypothetical protein [Candidatus Eisenbacteria bacterium]
MNVRRLVTWVMLVAYAGANGCTALREVPRAELAAKPERKGVHVLTRDSLAYDFDYATFGPDSLTGYRDRNDLEGVVTETAVHRIALDDVEQLRARRIDWYRTGLVYGGALVAVVAAGLTLTVLKKDDPVPVSGGPRGTD